MLCRWIRDSLTAYADGELRGWRAVWVGRHLAGCVACGQEAAAIAGSVTYQRRMLRALGPEPVDADELWNQVRRRLRSSQADGAAVRERSWIPTRRLVLAAAATCVVVGVLVARSLDPWLIVVGLEDPPRLVVEKPELFVDYPLFEHLDAIENLDNPESGEGDQERGLRRG